MRREAVVPARNDLRPHELDHHRRTILLVVGIGLVVAPVLQLRCVGIEGQEPLQGPVVQRQLMMVRPTAS